MPGREEKENKVNEHAINFKNISRVLLEAVASIASGTSLVVSLIQDPLKLARGEDIELPIEVLYMILIFVTILTTMDAFVHYTIYDEYSDDKKPAANTELQVNPANETTPLLDITEKNMSGYKVLVFCCTLSCSFDSAGAPAALIYILEALKIIGGTNSTVHVTRLSTTLGASLVALWNSGSQWNMGMTHLQEFFDKRAAPTPAAMA